MKAVLFLLAGIACLPVYAQKKTPARTTPTEIRYDSFFAAVKWRNIGPFRGGRANAICGVPHSDNTYYVGYAGGGVWKTQDAGESWYNISDGFFTVGSIGDIAVAESDPNVVVVGSGEHAVRGVMTSYGDGVYKSSDAGRTWKNIGLTQTRHIADVVIHPANPDIMWVAAQGTVHGPNPDRGIYKTSDGGATWKKVLFINDSTGISSLSLDKTNPRILYAASWTHQRFPWTVSSGGSGSGLWRSVDGGETWKKINTGLPLQLGKIGISVSPANPSRVYAIVEAEKTQSGLYRSDDRGEHWNLLSSDQDICSRSWYYMEVQADPNNENTVYVMNAPLMRSIDGGRTFSKLKIEHGDTHDLWINPANSNNIALADDGGASVSFNFGSTWSTLNNQPTGQFYRVNTDNLFPYKIYGGQQDNTSVIISSRNNGSWITERDWSYGPGCESAYLAFDPENP
ncbi:MAG: WD40/YVTN/BNR-like repeat-containing protein, partial [Chitinophagaceae bacterium]